MAKGVRILGVDIPDKLLPVLILIFAVLIRTLFIFMFTTPSAYITSDMAGYNIRAENFIKGNPAGNEPVYMAVLFPPFYSMFLSVCYIITKLLGLYALKYNIVASISIFLSSLAAVFVFLIGKKLFSRNTGLLAAVLFIFSYQTAYLNAFLMSENLFTPLLIASVYIAVCRLKGKASYAVLGIITGLTAITRTAGVLLLAIYPAWFYLNDKRKRFGSLLKKTACFIIPALIILGSEIAYNYAVSDGEILGLSANSGLNFAMLHCKYAKVNLISGGYRYIFWATAHDQYEFPYKELRTIVPFSNQPYYYSLGIACIKKDPIKRLTDWQNVIYLFNGGHFPNTSTIPYENLSFAIAKILNYLLLIPASIFAFIRYRRKVPAVLLLAAIFVTLLASAYAFYMAEERYLVPYYFIFFILGAGGIAALYARLRKRYRI